MGSVRRSSRLATIVLSAITLSPSLTESSEPPAATSVSAPLASASGPPQRARSPEGDLDLSQPVIRSAVAAANEEHVAASPRGVAFGNTRDRSQARTDRAFKAAEIESCGGPGAYKFDPPVIGPIGLGGLFAVPFLVHAMATGRCKL